MESMFVNQNLK